MKLRNRISPSHPVFGGWRKLEDDDVLMDCDETACVSKLLSLDGDVWGSVLAEVEGCIQGLQSGWYACHTGDLRRRERVFRRCNDDPQSQSRDGKEAPGVLPAEKAVPRRQAVCCVSDNDGYGHTPYSWTHILPADRRTLLASGEQGWTPVDRRTP